VTKPKERRNAMGEWVSADGSNVGKVVASKEAVQDLLKAFGYPALQPKHQLSQPAPIVSKLGYPEQQETEENKAQRHALRKALYDFHHDKD
jgi:hypothetical protein